MRYVQRAEVPAHRELALFALSRTGMQHRSGPGAHRRHRAVTPGAQPRVECDARARP
jgi:hypothetical protein